MDMAWMAVKSQVSFTAMTAGGNQIQETNSLGEMVKEKRYNAANRPVMEFDGMGNRTEFTYLPDGQMERVSRGSGSQKSRSRVTSILPGDRS